MVLVEDSSISGQIFHKKRLIGSVVIAIRCQTDTVDDATGISIDNKNRLAGGVDYYGVGCFLPDTPDRKKLLAERFFNFV